MRGSVSVGSSRSMGWLSEEGGKLLRGEKVKPLNFFRYSYAYLLSTSASFFLNVIRMRRRKRRYVLLAGFLVGAFFLIAEPPILPTHRRRSWLHQSQGRYGNLRQGLGSGQPVVFSPWLAIKRGCLGKIRCFYLASNGYRCIAHDRRGHGRSGQPWTGNEMDTYADDLAAVIETLGLQSAVHIGHSTGGGEVARYIGRHGTKRVAKAVSDRRVPPSC